MKINIIPNGKVSLFEIKNFEKKNNITIPNNYKNFLVENNGGNAKENKYKFITTYGKPYYFQLVNLMTIKELEIYKDDENFLIIGNALSGTNLIKSYICIYITNELNRYGNIYLCDLGGDIDLIASNFAELINYHN